MAATSFTQLRSKITGDIGGPLVVEPAAITNSSAPAQRNLVTLSAGTNNYTKPTNAVMLVLIPPVGNTVLVTLKLVVGDSGFPLHKTNWTVISCDSTLTTFVLTAGGTIAGFEMIWL